MDVTFTLVHYISSLVVTINKWDSTINYELSHIIIYRCIDFSSSKRCHMILGDTWVVRCIQLDRVSILMEFIVNKNYCCQLLQSFWWWLWWKATNSCPTWLIILYLSVMFNHQWCELARQQYSQDRLDLWCWLSNIIQTSSVTTHS